MQTPRLHIILFVFSLAAVPAVAQQVIYVNHAATGANTGTSWTDAFTFLQDALAGARSGDEVWVAQGIYRPDQGAGVTLGDRDASFTITSGVSLVGGFNGTEASGNERDWIRNESVLSGDLLANDDELVTYENPLREDNSFHVVTMADLYEAGEIDGFTIQDGHGNVSQGARRSGTGVLVRSNIVALSDTGFLATISNCTIQENVSSSVIHISRLDREEPSALIQYSTVRYNKGLGISTAGEKTVIKNTIFSENESVATTAIAGGNADLFIIDSTVANNIGDRQIDFKGNFRHNIYMWNTVVIGNNSNGETVRVNESNLLSVNNIFGGNVSDHFASAIQTTDGSAVFVNNVFAFNKSTSSGSVVLTRDTNTFISNSIFWQNESPDNLEIKSWDPANDDVQIGHSIIQLPLPAHVIDLGGMMTGDPLFEDEDGPDNILGTIDDNYRLKEFSPLIDAGDNSILPIDEFDVDRDGDSNELWPLDAQGHFRFVDGGSGSAIVDIGAYEWGSYLPPILPYAVEEDQPVDRLVLTHYPNPFSSSSILNYSLPRPTSVILELYDITGRRIRVIEEGFRATGLHEVQLNTSDLSAGIYFLRLTARDFSQTRKMVVMK